MNIRTPLARLAWACVLVAPLASLSAPQRGSAGEPFNQFLDALRERQLFDTALDYLNQMRTSNLIKDDLKVTIPYQEARTLIDQARSERDPNQKAKQLDQATVKLDEFIQANPKHPQVGAAAMQRGTVIVERGAMVFEDSKRPSQAANKEALAKQARTLYDQAIKVFADAEKQFTEEYEKYPKFIDPAEVDQIAARDQAQTNAIQAQMYNASTLYEKSKTFIPPNAESKQILQAAADQYEKVYQSFRGKVAGLVARLKQGQCYQELGDTRRALGYYRDILLQPDEITALRRFKASAMYLSMQCWITEGEGKWELATIEGEKWLNTARGLEDRQPDWLATRYNLAQAYKLWAEKDTKADKSTKDQRFSKARQHALEVAKYTSPYQDSARQIVRDLSGGRDIKQEPKNFTEAVERGKTNLDDMGRKEAELVAALKTKPEEVEGLKKAVNEAWQKAVDDLMLALSLRDSDTDINDVNNVRYYLCYLNYKVGRNYDAAVLGDFIARNYPNSAGARQAAKIAMAAYLAGYNDKSQSPESRADDRDRLVKVADYICKRWQEEQEATDALAIAVAVLVADKSLERAAEYLEKMPANSPHRGSSELKLGQAYWTQYIAAQATEEKDRPPQAEQEKMIAEAQRLLQSGLDSVKKSVEAGQPITLEIAVAALSAAQVYLNAGQPEKALALLEDPKIGPLTLAKDKNPVAQQADFAVEAYKAALRSYVGVQNLDAAEGIMDQLEQTVGSGANGRADLTKIYISLGKQLEEQIKLLDDKPEEKKKVAQGFEKFLEKISTGEEGNTFSSLNWVAETFFALGQGYDTDGKVTPQEAKAYYQKAFETDKRLLLRSEAEKGFSPSEDATVAVEVRQARAMRRLDQFDEALKQLAAVVKKKPFLLDAHKEAALVYMDQGREKDPAYYTEAILGAREPGVDAGAPLFWGWAGLAQKLGDDKRFVNDSFEARYQISNCRALQAEAGKNQQDKSRFLREAEYNIMVVFRTRFAPDSEEFPGKDDQRKRFEALLKTIQKQMGKDAVGFKAFDDQATAGAR